eukprot:scaffold63681_cov87-Cyclotella_meneghiniana.AAC.1
MMIRTAALCTTRAVADKAARSQAVYASTAQHYPSQKLFISRESVDGSAFAAVADDLAESTLYIEFNVGRSSNGNAMLGRRQFHQHPSWRVYSTSAPAGAVSYTTIRLIAPS